jgi:alpha-glucosidase
MRNDEWWRGAAIYQIYPRSFHDSNGDGIGDLPGVTAKLDYVASLGVDAIWLSPFFASPMRDFGYDVADHRAVDPIFGTLEDFDALLERAHELGLKVIIDQVWGHTSDEHHWFRQSRADRDGAKSDWYVWAEPRPDGTPPNNWLSVFGGSAWSWEPRRRQYYLHHFLASQPTLNLRNPAVLDALLDTAQFWLERGVDGFRLDALDFLLHDLALRDNPPRPPAGGMLPAKPFGLQRHLYDMIQPEVSDLLARLRALADRYPGSALLGEVSSQDGAYARIARYTKEGRGLHMAYTLRPLRGGAAAGAVEEALAETAETRDDGWMCWAFSNHDVERVASRWNASSSGVPTAATASLLMSLLLSLRGSICLYQGEELGLTEAELALDELRDPFGIAYYPEFRGRDGSRTPMPWTPDAAHAGFTTGTVPPWLPVPRQHYPLSVAAQEEDPDSMLHLCRHLVAWRKAHPALRLGALHRWDLPAPLIGFERTHDEERLLVVFNLGDRPMRFALEGNAGAQTLELPGAVGFIEGGIAVLPPWGTLVVALESEAVGQQDEPQAATG